MSEDMRKPRHYFPFIKMSHYVFLSLPIPHGNIETLYDFLHAWQLSINPMICFFSLSLSLFLEIKWFEWIISAFKSNRRFSTHVKRFRRLKFSGENLRFTPWKDFVSEFCSCFYSRQAEQVRDWNTSTVLYNKECPHFMGLWISVST